MSLLGGYDMILEVTNPTLLRFLESQIKLNGVAIAPPFELDLGTAFVIANALTLELAAGDAIVLTVSFDDSTVFLFGATIDSLDGTIAITASIGKDAQGLPTVDLSGATVAVKFSPAAKARVAAVVPFIDPDAAAGTVVQTVVQAQGAFSLFPGAITVDPTQEGHLFTGSLCGTVTPALQLVSLEAHTIANADPARQALAFCGTLIGANQGKGNPALKTDTAVPPGNDVCVSLSAEAFDKLLFCPATTCIDPQHPADVPKPCGGGKGISVQGVTITQLSESFEDGQIRIRAAAQTGGFCYTASGNVEGTLKLGVSSGALTATLDVPAANFGVSIDDWCWVAAAFLGGPVGLVAAGVIQATANQAVDAAIGKAIHGALAQALPSVDPNLPNMTLGAAVVTTEGLTVSGRAAFAVPTRQRGLALSGSVTTSQTETIQSGTTTITAGCLAGDYPFDERAQQQLATYEAVPSLLGRPLQLAWSISAGTTTVALSGAGGTAELPGVPTSYPFPLLGGTMVTQTVHLDYTFENDLLRVSNRPAEGNFAVGISCVATDPVGRSATAYASFQFEGDAVTLGGNWDAQVAECARELRDRIRKLGQIRQWGPIPPWVPVDHPAPEALGGLIRALVAAGGDAAGELLAVTRLAHGRSFQRALTAGGSASLGSVGLGVEGRRT